MRKQLILSSVTILISMLLLAGCESVQPNDTISLAPRWKSAIDQALADPELTTFERQVMSDYVITDAEYREAQNRYVQCMASQGWSVTIKEEGGYTITAAPGSGHDGQYVPESVDSSCMLGTLNYIEPIYLGIRDNPQAITPAQQIRSCYSGHNVPDGDGLSDDAFEAMIYAPDYIPSTSDGMVCFLDPTGSNGVTTDQAENYFANRQPSPIITYSSTPQPTMQ